MNLRYITNIYEFDNQPPNVAGYANTDYKRGGGILSINPQVVGKTSDNHCAIVTLFGYHDERPSDLTSNGMPSFIESAHPRIAEILRSGRPIYDKPVKYDYKSILRKQFELKQRYLRLGIVQCANTIDCAVLPNPISSHNNAPILPLSQFWMRWYTPSS